ncbi:helix-turn-helix domain-containing protein [Rhodoferax sp. WC2427]|uniref:helix-turn-helix domain-containing protein n=1 Tax=Rhodoferax sp. WC2427 TaxID=3234144 RepID=UPI0034666C5F
MQPWLEQVTRSSGQSWTLFDRQLPAFPFNWHYHPEFELTLTLNSSGQRFVGDHVGQYFDADLVLVGPNLPHAWQSRTALDPSQPHRALVLWFQPQWAYGLTQPYPELDSIVPLLADARRGVAFSAAVVATVRPRLLALVDMAPAQRWLGLVEVLLLLAADRQRQLLALQGFASDKLPRDRARLDRVLAHLHAHYAEPIRLETLADLAAMSVSQLQRAFKRSTRSTVSGYLAQLRIGHACALLLDGNRPIAQIAEATGYRQQGYFTRQFRAVKGMAPLAFRRGFGAASPSAKP